MSIYRYLGAMLLFCCGAGVGVMLARAERRRCREAQRYAALMRHIRTQIAQFSTPVAAILAGCDADAFCEIGLGTGRKFEDLAALLRGSPPTLPREMCEMLWGFAAELGGSYREEQLRCCDAFLTRFEAACTQLRAELPKKEKMLLVVPTALAAILALALL
jgi:hypothetical protein